MTQSFASSVIVFIVLVMAVAIWQLYWRRGLKAQMDRLDLEMTRAGELAQRRHAKRFGRANTAVEVALKNGHSTATKHV